MAQEQHALHPHPRTAVREQLEQGFIRELLTGGAPAKRVVNVHSITGMGKTWLGYLMFSQTALPAGAMAVWVSFEQTEEKPLPNVEPNPPIVRVPNDQLLVHLEAQPFRKRLNLGALELLAKMFGERFACHYRLAPDPDPNGPLLLFFDALNDLVKQEPEQPWSMASPWDYAETQIFEPAAQQTNTLTFCFSHAPLMWNSYYLREMGETINLAAMTRTEVKELLRMHQLSGQIVEDFVYDVSQGHPWTIRYLLLEDPGLLRAHSLDLRDEQARALGPEDLAESISALPDVYRELLQLVGVQRIAEIAPIEALLASLGVKTIQGQPITRRLLRGALAAFGSVDLFETSSDEQRTRFSAALRRRIEEEAPYGRLVRQFQIIADYYYHQSFFGDHVTSPERYGALREWLYAQLKLVRLSQVQETDLRRQIDELSGRVADVLREARTFFHTTFDLEVTGSTIWLRSGALQDPEIDTMLASLGLAIDADGLLALSPGTPPAQARPAVTLDTGRYNNEVTKKLLPQIIEPYGLAPDDIQPLAWIAQHQEDQGMTLDMLREAHRQLGRPEPKSSLLRYHLSRYTAANIVRYNYERNVYYLNDWLRGILRRWGSRPGGTLGVAP